MKKLRKPIVPRKYSHVIKSLEELKKSAPYLLPIIKDALRVKEEFHHRFPDSSNKDVEGLTMDVFSEMAKQLSAGKNIGFYEQLADKKYLFETFTLEEDSHKK